MKKILVILMLVFAFGCSDDVTAPSDNELVGTWKTGIIAKDDITGESIDVNIFLKFLSNGKFNLSNQTPSKFIVNEYGTYTINDSIITIFNNKCDKSGGKYKFELRDNGVEFTRIEDICKNNYLLSLFFIKYEAEEVKG